MGTTYRVEFTLTIDRPELRGPTYPNVAPGTKVQYTETFEQQREAKAFMARLANGTCTMWVCESEFVTSCYGVAINGGKERGFGGYRYITREGANEAIPGYRARGPFNLK